MSFGPRATVLEPAELVTEIEQDLNQMLAGYDARKEVT
jgi:predicted DNA-binding transcriptional regulator YafY